MRLVKMFGLAAIAAVAAMAFVGATSASAEPTLLCNAQHEEGLACPEGQATSTFSGEAIGIATLLNNVADVLCLHVLGTFNALALGSPQEIHPTELIALECGTNAAHNNCVVTVEEFPLFLLLKTALNLGTIEGHDGAINVKCTILGFIKIDCTYAAELEVPVTVEGALHTEGAGNGKINLVEVPAELTVGGGLCPTESSLDAVLEPSKHIWIAS